MTDIIDSCFLPPPNWQCDFFTNPDTKHTIRFCSLPSERATANLVILPGLSEFSEKYIETANFFNRNNFNVTIIDWAYQGHSSRYQGNRHKRHSNGYDADISDLDFLINHKLSNDKPLYFLAHSMGGHIALRYLIKRTNNIKAAAMSAPMIQIKDFKYGARIAEIILKLLTPLHHTYVPGGNDWREDNRPENKKDVFSCDPKRKKIHNYWNLKDTKLQIGSPTLKWLYESLKSIRFVQRNLTKIKIPVLLATADEEELVDNYAIIKAAKIIPHAKLIELENSKHEIMMETDAVRDKFLNEALSLFKAQE